MVNNGLLEWLCGLENKMATIKNENKKSVVYIYTDNGLRPVCSVKFGSRHKADMFLALVGIDRHNMFE